MIRIAALVLALLAGSAVLVESQAVGIVCWGIGGAFQSVCTTTPDGVRITFNPNGTNAGLNAGAHTADPSSPSNGDVFYNSTSNQLRARINGAWVELGGSAGNIQTLLDGISTTQGVILYYNGTDWVALSPGTSGQFLKTNGASANPAWADGGSGNFTKIEETTPTGTSTTFSSLGSYTHLKIIYSARGDTSATSVGLNMTFNSDTGANYDDQRSQFTTSSSFANDVAANFIVIGVISAATATSNYAGGAEIVFPDYRGTTFFKTAIANGTYVTAQSSGSIFNRLFVGHWRSTSAITSITITLNAGNFVSGSKFTLYGMN